MVRIQSHRSISLTTANVLKAPLPPGLKKPSARAFRQARLTGAVHSLAPLKTFRSDAAVSDSFLSSKRDKKLMKHSSFLSRVAASSSSAITKKNKRTGRGRSKKLSTTLDSLADALPELAEGEGDVEALKGKIRHKSLKSKKGALKRKEQVVKGEMERFGVSMAQLSGTKEAAAAVPAATTTTTGETATAAAPGGASNRWAALRGYISSTMEQNPAFAGK